MKKHWIFMLSFGFFFLLFVQSITVFIESIYILELLSTSLDEKVLGVLFLFSPVFLFFFGKRVPRWLIWGSFILFMVGRGMIPYLDTTGRMVAAGVASAAGLILLPLLLVTYRKPNEEGRWLIPAQGLALAVGLSVLLRTLNYTIDPTLTSDYGWLGWLLGFGFGLTLIYFKWEPAEDSTQPVKGITSAAIGLMGLLTIFYFMFSSPGVIARWTEGNYALIITMVSLLSMLWLFISFARPTWLTDIKPNLLLIWNCFFTLAVVGTILAQTISFPAAPDSAPMVVTSPTWYEQIPLVLMLLSFPVVFMDFGIFSGLIVKAHPVPRKMAPGFLLGSLVMVVLIFMNIFTNVWGYVEPVSPFFRNKFWLPFLLVLGLTTILTYTASRRVDRTAISSADRQNLLVPAMVSGLIFLATFAAALLTDRIYVEAPGGKSLTIMTYNIQQANDEAGEKSYQDQLALIKLVNPDVIGFQESDSARISLGNNDYIRYYANQLGYHAYFGPKTVTGTYGTAILSKYPLENPRSVFTFSDQDEIGTAEAEITVGGKQFTIFNVHPAGSDKVMLVFATTLVERANQKEDVIAIGDYNLRGWEEPYLLIDAHYKNAWMDAYPSGIDDQGLDMSGEERIDHIFVSPHLQVSDPVYVLPPESRTDHPVHWAQIIWD
jgi:endonuclease/exonuclease/phosphatase family metal-dependent hydrolase